MYLCDLASPTIDYIVLSPTPENGRSMKRGQTNKEKNWKRDTHRSAATARHISKQKKRNNCLGEVTLFVRAVIWALFSASFCSNRDRKLKVNPYIVHYLTLHTEICPDICAKNVNVSLALTCCLLKHVAMQWCNIMKLESFALILWAIENTEKSMGGSIGSMPACSPRHQSSNPACGKLSWKFFLKGIIVA